MIFCFDVAADRNERELVLAVSEESTKNPARESLSLLKS
jgi:hypothetical protein